jgi:hypothetical protein
VLARDKPARKPAASPTGTDGPSVAMSAGTMRAHLAVAAGILATFVASVAVAQDDPTTYDSEKPSPAPAPPVASSAAAGYSLQCAAGDQTGIDRADARTATALVCAEVAKAGPPADAQFRVSLGRLGSIVVLSVARVGGSSGTSDLREIRLSGIEEVAVAAPRIAESIVRGTPLADTAKVDNIVGEEARTPRVRSGKLHFGLGLVGQLPPLDHGLAPSPGVMLDLHYESHQWELGGSFRAGGGGMDNSAPHLGFVSLSLGGRYFTSDADFSPYVGGGLSWGYQNLSVPAIGFQGDNSGLGAYADAGVEVMRSNNMHLAFGLRFDLPFYSLNANTTYTTYAPGTTTGSASSQSSFYYAPLSIEARLTF